MKKKCFSLFLLLTALISVSAIELNDLQFSLTVKDLSRMTAAELTEMAEAEQWLLLDGSIAALTRLSAKEEEYILDARLIQGEWVGLDEVLKYDCHLIFQGDRWMEVVPEKTPRKPAEEQILLNNRVLVLGRVLGYDMENGQPVAYLMVDRIRKLR